MNQKHSHWKRSIYSILAGQAVSLVTSGILQMAIIFYLTDRTGSAMVLSLATLAGFLPQALLGPFIGVLVDRWNRKAVLIGADLLIALAGAILAFAAIQTSLPVWLILTILFLRSIGTAFHTPALSAVTPLIVPRDHLTRTSGFSQSILSVSYILSPAGGALFYAVWPLERVISLDIAGAAVASLAVAMAKIQPLPLSGREKPAPFLHELAAGWRALRAHNGLFTLMWTGTLYMFVYMPINALFPLMSTEYFGGTSAHAAAAEIAFAAGMLLGGLLLGAWGGFKRKTHTICLSILLMGAGLTVAGLLPRWGFIGFAACCLVMGASGPLYGVVNVLYQEQIRPEYLGRVFSLSMSLMSLTMPLGLLFSGFFAQKLGVGRWFLLSGLAILGIALLTWRLPAIRGIDAAKQASEGKQFP